MALRQPVNLTDKASLNPITSGAALTAELSNVAYPESSNKRWLFNLLPINRNATAGTTATELFIGGVANFRMRPADQSVMLIRVLGVYTCSVAASDSGFEIVMAVANRGGTVTFLGTATNVKFPVAGAGTPTLTPTIVAGNIVITAAGAAGDANGRWQATMQVSEVTDLG